MRFLWSLLLLLISFLLHAQQPHTASLYARLPNGSLAFTCTAFPIAHKGDKYTLLTADHCIERGMNYVTFEGADPQFHPALVGDSDEDYAYLTVQTQDSHALFELGDSLTLRAGDNLEVIANTYGIGEGIYRGHVILTQLTRPMDIDDSPADIDRYFVAQLPLHGGASGSPVLKDGKVVGIAVAQRDGSMAIVLKINVVK